MDRRNGHRHDLQIRSSCQDDSPAIARLISQLGYPTSTEEMQARLKPILEDTNQVTLVAEYQNAIIGMVGAGIGHYYERNGSYGRIFTIVVDEAYRSQGVGSALVAAIEHWLRSRDVISIIINSGTHRREAHRFYERLGYQETGIRLVKFLPTIS
jgi:GNAT superfamily N-acetyltransferase